MNPTLLAAGLAREIIELDISSITASNETNDLSDDDNDSLPSLTPQNSAYVKRLLNIGELNPMGSLSFSMSNRDPAANRMASLRMPTMGVGVPNMYLARPNANASTTATDNQHVLVNRSLEAK